MYALRPCLWSRPLVGMRCKSTQSLSLPRLDQLQCQLHPPEKVEDLQKKIAFPIKIVGKNSEFQCAHLRYSQAKRKVVLGLGCQFFLLGS